MHGLDIQLEQSSPVRKQNWLQVEKYNQSYTVFLGVTYGLVVKVSHSESDDLGSIPDDC